MLDGDSYEVMKGRQGKREGFLLGLGRIERVGKYRERNRKIILKEENGC